MTALPTRKFTVDEYLVWAENMPGRYELYEGRVYAQASERAGHANVKFAVQTELVRAISVASAECQMMPDGMTVRIDDSAAYEPDALVYCGDRVSRDVVEIPNSVIVVEVLSPSTRRFDAFAKLAGYFQVESIEHYLIVDPDKPPVIHHARQLDGTILTRIVTGGEIKFEPPGIEIDVDRFFV